MAYAPFGVNALSTAIFAASSAACNTYVNYNLEIPDDVIRSLESIQQEITAAFAKVGDASPAVAPLRAMRVTSREFVTEPHPDFPYTGQDRHHRRRAFSNGFFVALVKLRGTFGQQSLYWRTCMILILKQSWPRSCRPNRGQAMIEFNAGQRARSGWKCPMRSL